MRPTRLSSSTLITVLLMWLMPLCPVINSGLELLMIPGNAPKIAARWDYNGENNSISAEREVHHIPPAHRHVRHHQQLSIAATAPPKKLQLEQPAFVYDRLPEPPYLAAFTFTYPEITVPPPEPVC